MIAVIGWQSLISRAGWTIVFALAIYFALQKGWVSFDKVERLGQLLDTTGGKIMVLVFLTLIFFSAAVGYGYYVMEALEAHTLSPDNALVNLLLQFVCGTAFGTALGALISLLGGGGGHH